VTDADYTCTLYNLFLGDQDDTTGWYRMGYTEGSILCPIFPKGAPQIFTLLGKYTQYNLTGFTRYTCYEGDVVKDSAGFTYLIVSVTAWRNGNIFMFNVLEMEYLPNFSVPTSTDRFFGFEDAERGTIGSMFEDGFERGYWAELTY
jgi:hypothetical protein